jgi:16S rRNA (adenine1518-N6/adenine1519-N6)-dimethyltransferase
MAAKKPRLGQNFLIDENACRSIVDGLGNLSGRMVVEIGPGHGAITALLEPQCRRLHCVELDPALARELSFRFRNDVHVSIHHADILQTDLGTMLGGATSLDVIGNLPYYITSDILLHLFAAARKGIVARAVVMMQREVAERIAALPGSSDYGALSAATQMHARVTNLLTLPPEAFSPPPDVYSAVLRLDFEPRFAELGVDFQGFNQFLRVSFAQKRKTLANNLRAAGYTSAHLAEVWPSTLAPQIRSEAVGLEDMARLYGLLRNSGVVP